MVRSRPASADLRRRELFIGSGAATPTWRSERPLDAKDHDLPRRRLLRHLLLRREELAPLRPPQEEAEPGSSTARWLSPPCAPPAPLLAPNPELLDQS
jgi:hypothetical protein